MKRPNFMFFIAFFFLLFVFLIFSSINVSALHITYSVEVNANNSEAQAYFESINETKECENKCEFDIPLFNIPENYSIQSYHLDFEPNDEYNVYFTSTSTNETQNLNDTVTIIVLQQPDNTTNNTQNQTPQIVCDETRCDIGCVKCDDGCHPPKYKCLTEFKLEKLTPSLVQKGESQINLLIRNTGNEIIRMISAEITGDGITTISAIPIEELLVSDKDYVFVKINASKSGNIDIVIKFYIGKELISKEVEQIYVLEEKPTNTTVPVTEKYNVTLLNKRLEALKEKHKSLEVLYTEKKAEGYYVDIIYDNLKVAMEYIKEVQINLVESNYKKASTGMDILEELLVNIDQQLQSAKKTELSSSEKFRNKIIYFGSIAAAIVSILTAFTLIRNHINKQKILELHQKISKLKQKQAEDTKREDKIKKKTKKTGKGKKPEKHEASNQEKPEEKKE